jgi:hypothetical protein
MPAVEQFAREVWKAKNWIEMLRGLVDLHPGRK